MFCTRDAWEWLLLSLADHWYGSVLLSSSLWPIGLYGDSGALVSLKPPGVVKFWRVVLVTPPTIGVVNL